MIKKIILQFHFKLKDEIFQKIIKREHILNGSILTVGLFKIQNLNSDEKLNFKKTSDNKVEKKIVNKLKKIEKKESKPLSILSNSLNKENFINDYFNLSNFLFRKENVFTDKNSNKKEDFYFLNKKRYPDNISILSHKENFNNNVDFLLDGNLNFMIFKKKIIFFILDLL